MRQIEKLLKFDPTNVQLLTQKQKALEESVQATAQKLNTLKEAEAQVVAQFERGEIGADQLRAFQREIITTESSLNTMESALDEVSHEIKVLNGEVDETGDAMNHAGKASHELNGSFNTLEGMTAKVSGGFTVMKGALANLVADGIRNATNAIIDFGKESIQTGMDFQASMAEVAAISGATGEDFRLLEETAKAYGASTTFSASESAQALKYMALAGWDAKQSTDALGGVLNLAASAGMDLAKASDMVTDYLTAFGMSADKSGYFADMLAYAQSHANTTAEQLGEAFKNCAANLNASGQSVEVVTSLLSMMANQGLKGSEAGTALSAVMRDITAKMNDGKIAIGDTSIAVMDEAGNFNNLLGVLRLIEAATADMGDAERASALSATFTADSIKGLNLMLNAGIDSASDFTEALEFSSGSAAKMAETMNDTLTGDLKQMGSALEDLQIAMFEGLEPTLRDIVQTLTGSVIPAIKEMIPSFNEFVSTIVNNGPTILATITGIGAGFLTWNVSTMIMGVVTAVKAYTVANEGATVAQALLNTVMKANPIILVVSLVASLVAALVTFIATNENARAKLAEVWETIKTVVGVVVDALVVFFTETVPAAFDEFVETVSALPDKIGAFFTETIPAWIDTVVKWFSDLPGRVAYAIGVMIGNLATWAYNMYLVIQSEIPKVIEAVRSFFAELPGKIRDAIATAITHIQKWVTDIATKLKTEVPKIIESTRAFFAELPGKIWNAIVGAIAKVGEWLSQMKTKAKAGITEVKDAIINTMKTIPDQMLSIGKNIVSGIFNGISNMRGWILDKIGDFASGIVQGFKDSFSIHSPSRVMRDEVGKYIAQGVIAGVEDEIEAVKKSADELADVYTGFGRDNIDGANLERNISAQFAPAMGGTLADVMTVIRDYGERIINASNHDIVLDSGALVGQTVGLIDAKLGARYRLNARGV